MALDCRTAPVDRGAGPSGHGGGGQGGAEGIQPRCEYFLNLFFCCGCSWVFEHLALHGEIPFSGRTTQFT